ncbi:CarD family transcriptional regulator [Salinibacterium sp. ZJ450]|uniref:CarD family transcriptional regulator n=1 Tax=Salinibacterium sp. ZJ450 TaxID=2708338 RepID=UPI001420A71E|nr:CarD family transcriptional regulator [Salinibacterium sp. ZJ450]
MHFATGQTIVHPHHGPATIRAITHRTVRSVDRSYLVLDVENSNLTISVPVDNAGLVGLRDMLSSAEIEALFDVLRDADAVEETRWSRRIKENREKLSSGDILNGAAVVRDLSRRMTGKGLSPAEKEMLRDAKRPLLTEVALALGISTDEANAVLDSVLTADSAKPNQQLLREIQAGAQQSLAS